MIGFIDDDDDRRLNVTSTVLKIMPENHLSAGFSTCGIRIPSSEKILSEEEENINPISVANVAMSVSQQCCALTNHAMRSTVILSP